MESNISRYYKGNLKWVVENTCLLVKAGSHAYGTNIASSDLDFRGVCIPTKEYFYGFLKNFEQIESKDPYDLVIFDIRKFFKLAANANPNILETLFVDDADIIFSNKFGDLLRSNKRLFLSQKCLFTYAGYAKAQLHKINTHYLWILNPATEPPDRKTFGLPEKATLSPDQYGAVESEIKKKMEEWDIDWSLLEPAERINIQSKISLMLTETNMTYKELWKVAAKQLSFDDNFIFYVQKEKEYKQKCADWASYQEWKKSRNPQRHILEAKNGYDTKNAMHLVRLLRMCREIITTGNVVIKRPDASELLEIRNGSWTYEELIAWADKEEKDLQELCKKCTVIPKIPDYNQLDLLCQQIIGDCINKI